MKVKNYLKSIKYKLIFEEFIICKEDFDEPEPKNYKRKYISTFDHWLTEDEYIKELVVSFSDVFFKRKINNFESVKENLKKYYEAELKFITLYTLLYTDYDLIFYNENEKKFYKYRDFDGYFCIFEDNIREKKFTDIYIPKLKCVIKVCYDLTIAIYYQRDKDWPIINDYITKASLHILE